MERGIIVGELGKDAWLGGYKEPEMGYGHVGPESSETSGVRRTFYGLVSGDRELWVLCTPLNGNM